MYVLSNQMEKIADFIFNLVDFLFCILALEQEHTPLVEYSGTVPGDTVHTVPQEHSHSSV